MDILLVQALKVATRAHAGQVDKSGEPYILHPIRVAFDYGLTTLNEQIVALLHDMIEDTPITYTTSQTPHTVTIVVHNENTGKPIQLNGGSTDSVQSFIDKLYESLRTTHKPDDRLRCGASGVNVFTYANLTIADFERQHCAAHEWEFAGATGGAYMPRSTPISAQALPTRSHP